MKWLHGLTYIMAELRPNPVMSPYFPLAILDSPHFRASPPVSHLPLLRLPRAARLASRFHRRRRSH